MNKKSGACDFGYTKSVEDRIEIGTSILEKITEYHNGDVWVCFGIENIEQKPAQDYSEYLDINICGDWKTFPELFNISPYHLNDVRVADFHYEKLVELNPVLGEIKLRTQYSKWDVCSGVVSNFNYEDIKYFVEIPGNERFLNEKSDKLEKESGYTFPWILSEYTINKIKKHFKKGD